MAGLFTWYQFSEGVVYNRRSRLARSMLAGLKSSVGLPSVALKRRGAGMEEGETRFAFNERRGGGACLVKSDEKSKTGKRIIAVAPSRLLVRPSPYWWAVPLLWLCPANQERPTPNRRNASFS